MLNWFTETFPAIIVGRSLGATSLGVFNAAFNLARTPASAIATGGLEMLFASGSRARGSEVFLQRAFRTALGLVGMVALPTFVALAVVPETVVIVLYGPLWTAAMPLLPPLALAMPAFMIAGVASAMMLSVGCPGRDMLVHALTAALVGAGVLVAIRHSTLAVAWTVFAAMHVRMVVSLALACRLAHLGWRDALMALWPGLLLAATIPLLVWRLDDELSAAHVHRAVVLGADAAAGAALLALGVLLLRPLIPGETRWAIGQALRRVPFGLTARLAPLFEAGAAPR
jgi:O-antigen/teichoic acid export membrane protein